MAAGVSREGWREPDDGSPTSVRWFAWYEVQDALAHARTGAISLHHFRYDLRRFGLGRRAEACHIMSADIAILAGFGASVGLPGWLLQEPRPHRPEVWHFDAFGEVFDRLVAAHPVPEGIDE